MHKEPQEQRNSEHAKLFSTQHGQVLAYLNRDENDALTVILQCWVVTTDEQLRAAIATDSDERAQDIFDALTDEGIEMIFDELGITETLAKIEAEHG